MPFVLNVSHKNFIAFDKKKNWLPVLIIDLVTDYYVVTMQSKYFDTENVVVKKKKMSATFFFFFLYKNIK
jgi:hypothetical protein